MIKKIRGNFSKVGEYQRSHFFGTYDDFVVRGMFLFTEICASYQAEMNELRGLFKEIQQLQGQGR